MDEETLKAENEDEWEKKTCFYSSNRGKGERNGINAGKSENLNIIFLKNPDYCMYIEDINTILDSPPCPKIKYISAHLDPGTNRYQTYLTWNSS